MPKRVTDIEFDEVSLVDRPANPHASVVIAKRADQEADVPDEFYDDQGQAVDLDSLDEGAVVYDGEGNPFQLSFEDEEVAEPADEKELVEVGKSAFAPQAGASPAATQLYEQLKQELSKAADDESRNAVMSKALDALSKSESRAREAEQIAKSEREIRLTREYISKAGEYNVPVAAEELGPVLMRMAERMPYEDCAVIHKALTAAGEMLYDEVGFDGSADNTDPFAQIDQYLNDAVAKADGKVSKAAALTEFFDNDPGAYDAYRAQLG